MASQGWPFCGFYARTSGSPKPRNQKSRRRALADADADAGHDDVAIALARHAAARQRSTCNANMRPNSLPRLRRQMRRLGVARHFGADAQDATDTRLAERMMR